MAKARRVLAAASAGGHWVQLLRLMSAFDGHEIIFVSTVRQEIGERPCRVVPDANRQEKLRMILLIVRAFLLIVAVRPDIVISTGAAPGYWLVRFGRFFGARTIWVDSFANVDELSMSGRIVKPYADLWLTQWPHLACSDGPEYAGAIL